MFTDFTNLNKACPNDYYPLPCLGRLVDGSAGHEIFDFLDASRCYHQIRLDVEDQEKTAFIKEYGLYCWRVMLFGLKNSGATYQSMKRDDHLGNLEESLGKLKECRLRINPQCNATFEELKRYLGSSRSQTFDEAGGKRGADGEQFEYVVHLSFKETNNEAEYEAMVTGFQMAKSLDITRLRVRGDSKFVIEQVRGDCGVKSDTLKKYHAKATLLAQGFEYVIFEHIPRMQNEHADHLSRVATTYFDEMPSHMRVEVRNAPGYEERAIMRVMEEEEGWRSPIAHFIMTGELINDGVEACKVKSRSYKF
ncbi:hypothetical protein LIER_30123 [Lithospermum erythrorhizon]|uniref:RNase H type-1 domain-containing protein n=1 Tax=Lithospermum erythrorhizon TaxID=34254 RepID=A0AAV3RQ57_LITER